MTICCFTATGIRRTKKMQFLIKAYDGEGMLEKRMAVRPRHLEGMKKLGKHIICAGGLLDDAGKMKGSALIPALNWTTTLPPNLISQRVSGKKSKSRL